LEKSLPVEDPNSSYLYFIFYILYFLKIPFPFSGLNFILQKKSESSEYSESSELSEFFFSENRVGGAWKLVKEKNLVILSFLGDLCHEAASSVVELLNMFKIAGKNLLNCS